MNMLYNMTTRVLLIVLKFGSALWIGRILSSVNTGTGSRYVRGISRPHVEMCTKYY